MKYLGKIKKLKVYNRNFKNFCFNKIIKKFEQFLKLNEQYI